MEIVAGNSWRQTIGGSNTSMVVLNQPSTSTSTREWNWNVNLLLRIRIKLNHLLFWHTKCSSGISYLLKRSAASSSLGAWSKRSSAAESCAQNDASHQLCLKLKGAIWAPGILWVFLLCSFFCLVMENEIAKWFLSKLVRVSKLMSSFPEQSNDFSKILLINLVGKVSFFQLENSNVSLTFYLV